MTHRLTDTFARCRAEDRAALVTFTMAGDPDAETALNVLKALPEAGADIVEFGMPFTDPVADGPSVQRAGIRALKNQVPLGQTLDMVGRFRAENDSTPIILMGYFNPIYAYGVEKFCTEAATAGVDGLIVVDVPAEMDAEIAPQAQIAGLDLIRLVTPTTDDKRLGKVLQNTSGFLYYVSIKGTTGAATANFAAVKEALTPIRAKTDLPIAVGFGIKTAKDTEEVGRFADAVVAGSVIVDALEASLAEGAATDQTVKAVTDVVKELRSGIDRGGKARQQPVQREGAFGRFLRGIGLRR
ncbi:tryptophan synthase subunit alpha [Paracoccaceae bacterium GXU_MW_L88]